MAMMMPSEGQMINWYLETEVVPMELSTFLILPYHLKRWIRESLALMPAESDC